MSELLERIVNRTRGPLSSLQPLAPPRFERGRPAQGAFGGPRGEILEPDTARPSRRKLRSPSKVVEPGASPAGGVPRRSSPADAGSTVSSPVPGAQPAFPSGSVGPRAEAPSTQESSKRFGERGSGASGGEESRRGGKPAEPSAPGAVATLAVPVAHARRTAERDPVQAAPPTPTAHEHAEVRPEITISIGHIEVRAAPAPPPPPSSRPSPRPQVSLADFLRQRDAHR
jgi:hypothetical protein